jgi:two-component system, sensor histidine kinase RpfC
MSNMMRAAFLRGIGRYLSTDFRVGPILSWCRQRLRGRPDSEHELTLNRLALSGAAFAYLLVAAWSGRLDAYEMIRSQGAYFAVYQFIAVAIFLHILYRPSESIGRRLLGMSIDFCVFSYGMHVCGETFAPLYPVYLWVVFGNGFRFGIPYLAAASALSVLTFGTVIATTVYWREHQGLSVGLLAALILLPAYVSTLIRKLSEAKRQAEEASRAKSVFLASISHEFRTPLNAIMGLSTLLSGTPLNSDQKAMCTTIGGAGRRLLTLINSVLDFSRAEEGRMPSKQVAFDLLHVLAEIRSMLSVEAEAKGLRFSVHCTTRTPPLVIGDKIHLENILINLVGNAIKFTERGYVVVAMDAVAHSTGKVRLRFEVTDTGIGISEEAQARVFDRFTQADETIIDRFGGTGLGLAIAKQLVGLQGGDIGVQSSLGKGSTFWFEVDVRSQERDIPSEHLESVPTILVTGNQEVRELVGFWAQNVTFATDFDEALKLAARRKDGAAVAIIYDETGKRENEAAFIQWADGNRPGTAAPILLTDAPTDGLPAPPLRSRFVTALSVPLDREMLAAGLRIARVLNGVGEHNSSNADSIVSARRPLTILVAEDNRTNQMVVTKILERAGHRVVIVDNGEAALDALDEGKFDLAILDLNMPIMNGIETAKLYRFASLGQSRVPIIALTADATEDAGRRCEEAGMDACLTKPIDPHRLIEAIDKLIESVAPGFQANPDAADGVLESRQNWGEGVPVDFDTLKSLENLGGAKFVEEITGQFVEDAAAILRKLGQAMASSDVQAFRELLHALRSTSANIGASAVFEMCLEWRSIAAEDLADNGDRHLKELQGEFERVCVALDRQVPERSAVA